MAFKKRPDKLKKILMSFTLASSVLMPFSSVYAEGDDGYQEPPISEGEEVVINEGKTVEDEVIDAYNLQEGDTSYTEEQNEDTYQNPSGSGNNENSEGGGSNEGSGTDTEQNGTDTGNNTDPGAGSGNTVNTEDPSGSEEDPNQNDNINKEEEDPDSEENQNEEELNEEELNEEKETEEEEETKDYVLPAAGSVSETVLLNDNDPAENQYTFVLSGENGEVLNSDIHNAGKNVSFSLPSIGKEGEYHYKISLLMPENTAEYAYTADVLSYDITVKASEEKIPEDEQKESSDKDEDGKSITYNKKIVLEYEMPELMWVIYCIGAEYEIDESTYRVVLESGNLPEGATLKYVSMSAEEMENAKNLILANSEIYKTVKKTMVAGTIMAFGANKEEITVKDPVRIRFRDALSSEMKIYHSNGAVKALMTTSSEGNPYPGSWNNCTWAAWKLIKDLTGISLPGWGNAGNWYSRAEADGYGTSQTPSMYSIAVWSNHVGVVTDISEDGRYVYIREGNFGGAYHEGWWPASGTRTNQRLLGYIHTGDYVVESTVSGDFAEGHLSEEYAEEDAEISRKLYRITESGCEEVEYTTDGSDIIFDTSLPGTYIFAELTGIDLDYEILDYNAHFRFADSDDHSMFTLPDKKEFHAAVDAVNEYLKEKEQITVGVITAMKLNKEYSDGSLRKMICDGFSTDLNQISHIEVFRVSDGNAEDPGHVILIDANEVSFKANCGGIYVLAAVDYGTNYSGAVSSTGMNRMMRVRAVSSSVNVLKRSGIKNALISASANTILVNKTWVGGSDGTRPSSISIHVVPRGVQYINSGATGSAATTYGTASSGISGVSTMKTATVKSVYDGSSFHTVESDVEVPTTLTYYWVTKSGTTLTLYDEDKTTVVATVTNYNSTTQTGTISYVSGKYTTASTMDDTTTNVSSLSTQISSNQSRIETVMSNLGMDD